jgi:hypothetical protein
MQINFNFLFAALPYFIFFFYLPLFIYPRGHGLTQSRQRIAGSGFEIGFSHQWVFRKSLIGQCLPSPHTGIAMGTTLNKPPKFAHFLSQLENFSAAAAEQSESNANLVAEHVAIGLVLRRVFEPSHKRNNDSQTILIENVPNQVFLSLFVDIGKYKNNNKKSAFHGVIRSWCVLVYYSGCLRLQGNSVTVFLNILLVWSGYQIYKIHIQFCITRQKDIVKTRGIICEKQQGIFVKHEA